jgi:hypothetical protein
MKHTKLFEAFTNESKSNFTVLVWHKGSKSWEDEEGFLSIEVNSLQQAKDIAKEKHEDDKEFSWGVYDERKDKIVFSVGDKNESVVNEDYYNNTDLYRKEFKKRGFKLKENYDDWEDWYYKDFELGRYVVGFENLESYHGEPREDSNKRWRYNIFFNPFPKYKKKLFGLIKSKERNLGKQIHYKDGVIDFGIGLFKVDNKSFMKKLFKIVDEYEKEAEKISSVDYLSDEESEYTGHPAVEELNNQL